MLGLNEVSFPNRLIERAHSVHLELQAGFGIETKTTCQLECLNWENTSRNETRQDDDLCKEKTVVFGMCPQTILRWILQAGSEGLGLLDMVVQNVTESE